MLYNVFIDVNLVYPVEICADSEEEAREIAERYETIGGMIFYYDSENHIHYCGSSHVKTEYPKIISTKVTEIIEQ